MITFYDFGGAAAPLASALFANDGANQPWHAYASYPSAFYDSTNGISYLSREAFLLNARLHRIVSYNHGSSTWGEEYTCGSSDLVDNDHGPPVMFRDAAGYLHRFGGAHTSALLHSRSVAVNDHSRWTRPTTVAATSYTYPHPTFDGTTLRLFLRKTVTTTPRRDTLVMLPSTSISGGAITYGTEVSLIDFGDDSRMYLGWTHDDGTDIWLFFTYSDGADTFRRHQYVARYVKSTGSLKSADGTRTDASLPISKATADTYYRVFTQTTNLTNIGAACVDASGNFHVAFLDGTGTAYDIKHLTISGGVVSSASTVASLTNYHRYNDIALVGLAGGNVELCYPTNASGTFTRGGDEMVRRTWNGSWGAAETIHTVTGSYAINNPTSVRNGHADLRLIHTEITQDSLNSTAGLLKSYAFGGVAARSVPTVDDEVGLQLSFDGTDAATVTYDESVVQPFNQVTFVGNAQLDTAQSKFGGSSLLLDGNGDYLTLGQITALGVGNSTNKTYEAWIRVSAFDTANHQTIMDTRGASGSNSSRGFTFYIDNSTLKLSFVAWNGSGSVVINIASTATISAGSWVHVAATRASGTWRLFINGNLENTGAESSAPGDFSGNLFNIGRSGVTATPRYFKGWIDELRVIHGRAQWTASFTPETSAYAKP